VTVLEDQSHLPEARWLGERLRHARMALRSNSCEVQLAAARACLGIVCLSRFLADQEPGLVRIAAAGAGPRREMWLGFDADLRHMPRIRAMIDALDSEVAAQMKSLDPD